MQNAATPKSPTNQTVDVAMLIDRQRISPLQLLIMLIYFGIMAIDGFDTFLIGYIASSLEKEWHIVSHELTPVLTAGLVGLMFGSFIFGPLADRLGRKIVLIGSMVFFGLTIVFSALSTGLTELTVLRFLTGLGLGCAMSAALTLTSEYCPLPQALVYGHGHVLWLYAGLFFRGGGLASAYLIDMFNWRVVLWLGGILPLVLVPVSIWFLPESARYLTLKRSRPEQVRQILKKIAPQENLEQVQFVVPDSAKGVPASELFRPALFKGTMLLWFGFFMSLLAMFLLPNWLPKLLETMGLTQKTASLVSMMFTAGGTTGAVVLGLLMDKITQSKVLMVSFSIAGFFIALLGNLPATPMLLALVVFLTGICLSGSQVGINALATTYYPTDCRATGVSWANSVGRLGSVIGSMIGGVMMSMQLSNPMIFVVTGIPAVIAGPAMLGFSIAVSGKNDTSSAKSSQATIYSNYPK